MKQVALILDVTRPYDRQVAAGIARYVREVAHWGLYAEDDPLAKMPDLRIWRGDGIIANLDDPKVQRAVRGLRLPVVGIGGAAEHPDQVRCAAYVTADNPAIARLAAEHLIERGFRHFAYVGLPHQPRKPWVRLRARAFAEHLRRHGFSCAQFRGSLSTARRWEPLQDEMTAWLGGQPTPLAVLACNDGRARHVMEAARRIGRRIPEDLAVLGVDDDAMICELADPPLSSVLQGTDQIGYTAARLLDQLMARRRIRQRWVAVPPIRISARRSTDVLAVQDPDVAAAMREIRRQIGDRPRVSQLARQLHLSINTLTRRFDRALGRGVQQEIQRVRAAAARELLLSGNLPQKQIARRVGYSSVQHMSAAFSRQLGATPGALRRKLK